MICLQAEREKRLGSAAGPSLPPAGLPTLTGSSTGAYVSVGARRAAAEEAEREMNKTSSGPTTARNYKKPELDNEEEFPSLGGPVGKHK